MAFHSCLKSILLFTERSQTKRLVSISVTLPETQLVNIWYKHKCQGAFGNQLLL